LDIVWDRQARAQGTQSSTAVVLDLLHSVTFATADLAVGAGSEGASMASVFTNEATLHGRRTTRVFLEGDVGDDVGLADQDTAVGTGFDAVFFFDLRVLTAGRFDGRLGTWHWRIETRSEMRFVERVESPWRPRRCDWSWHCRYRYSGLILYLALCCKKRC